MYSCNARRNEVSPNRMSFGRHSWRRVHTKRPAKAFGFGLLGVGAIGLIPVDRRTSRNAGQNFAFPIMKKVPHATEESGTFVGGVASHLNHPLGGGSLVKPAEADAARFQMNEETRRSRWQDLVR